MRRRRPPRPTSYVTGIPSSEIWWRIMEAYRANGPTLGVWQPPRDKPWS